MWTVYREVNANEYRTYGTQVTLSYGALTHKPVVGKILALTARYRLSVGEKTCIVYPKSPHLSHEQRSAQYLVGADKRTNLNDTPVSHLLHPYLPLCVKC